MRKRFFKRGTLDCFAATRNDEIKDELARFAVIARSVSDEAIAMTRPPST
jgi:hypothetical protein